MSAPQAVQDLVAKFKQDAERFRHPDYNEEQVRIEFINPLFEALGWDIRDSTHVVHEARVQVMERGRYIIKHPDYEFVSGKVTLFYLEAKKPFVSLKNNPAAAFQIRRYGWRFVRSEGADIHLLSGYSTISVQCAQK